MEKNEKHRLNNNGKGKKRIKGNNKKKKIILKKICHNQNKPIL